MKPTSIIFLLISLIIILTGWLVCHSAEVSAAEQNIQLFDTVVDGNNAAVKQFIIGSDEIYNKIDLIVDNADVYIYGGFSESMLELVNFSEGSYRQTMTNRIITVDTTTDIMSVIKFWESGFSFRGLRNYFRRSGSDANAAKRINIYLPSDSDINIVNISLGKGNVNVSNFNTSVDFNINIDEGNVSFTDFRTTSQISAELDSGSIYMRNVHAEMFEAVIAEGNITADGFSFNSANINGRASSVSLLLTPTMPDFTANLSARHGKITIFGDQVGKEYRQETSTGANAMITVSSGDIIIDRSEAVRVPPSGNNNAGSDDTGDTATQEATDNG